MAGMIASGWLDKITDDISEGFKGIKKDLTKQSKKSGPSVSSSALKRGDNIYYGFSQILVEGWGGVQWAIVKEKESVFSKEFTNYTKLSTERMRPFCLVGTRPANMAHYKLEKDDLVVRYGDTVLLWCQVGVGRFARTTAIRGFLVFGLEKPEMGEELKGSSCFRILNENSEATKEPIKYDDIVRFELCKSPGSFLAKDGDYVKTVANPQSEQSGFKVRRTGEKPSGRGPVVKPMAIAGTDEERAWYDKLQEGLNIMMDDAPEDRRRRLSQ